MKAPQRKRNAEIVTKGSIVFGRRGFSPNFACDDVAEVADDNTFALADVLPGECSVHFNQRPGNTYIKAITFDDKTTSGKPIEITPGPHTLTLTVSYNTGRLQGKVKDSASGPVAQATAALATDRVHDDGSGVHFAPYGAGGSFTFLSVPLSHYRVYAFENFGSCEWDRFQDPEFRKQILTKGTSVEVTQGDQTMIAVPLIPAGDVDQLLKP